MALAIAQAPIFTGGTTFQSDVVFLTSGPTFTEVVEFVIADGDAGGDEGASLRSVIHDRLGAAVVAKATELGLTLALDGVAISGYENVAL